MLTLQKLIPFSKLNELKTRYRSYSPSPMTAVMNASQELPMFFLLATIAFSQSEIAHNAKSHNYNDKRSGKPRLSSSTALSYFKQSFRTALTTAYERRIIECNPANLARPIRAEMLCASFSHWTKWKDSQNKMPHTYFEKYISVLCTYRTKMMWHCAYNLRRSKG